MTSRVASPLSVVEGLTVRGVALGLYGALLGPDPGPLIGGESVDRLAAALELLDETRALERLDTLELIAPTGADELTLRWVHWFDQGRVAPYECSNRNPTVAGHTAPIADIAGFYRAIDMKVQGDRPDHVVAELEFVSLVNLAEARARDDDRVEDADVHADLARVFLRDHLGVWLDGFAARVLAIEPPVPWGPIAASAAAFVASEANRRNVIPVRSEVMFDEITPELPELEEELECGTDE